MLYISLLLALLAVACLIFVPNTVILLSFVAIMHGFAVYSACHALLHKRDSRAALGWIAIILFMPPVGLPLYWLFGIARIDSQAVRLMEKAAQKVMGGLVDLHGKSLTEKPEGFIDKDEVPHAWHYLVNPGSSITGRCMLEGNDLTVLHNGEAAYPVMLKAISEAKERVFLSSFIFGYDEVGKSFAAALRAAAERGCDVRLLMDGVGSFHLWPSWRKRLGPDVKLAYFLPPHRLHGELVSAVLRGVDVSVILPGENNHRLVDWAMRHQMPMLADRGVKIYRQPPPFAHTKLLLIDGEYTLLGSANLDPRSLNLNFELVMEVLDLRLAEQLSAFYDEVRSRSVSVPTTYPALPYRLRNAASWIFSPYL